MGGWASGGHSYSAGVAGLFVLMGAVDPQCTRSIMESDICASLDPQPDLESLLLWVHCLPLSRSPDEMPG
jgi:hypothetical protein